MGVACRPQNWDRKWFRNARRPSFAVSKICDRSRAFKPYLSVASPPSRRDVEQARGRGWPAASAFENTLLSQGRCGQSAQPSIVTFIVFLGPPGGPKSEAQFSSLGNARNVNLGQRGGGRKRRDEFSPEQQRLQAPEMEIASPRLARASRHGRPSTSPLQRAALEGMLTSLISRA